MAEAHESSETPGADSTVLFAGDSRRGEPLLAVTDLWAEFAAASGTLHAVNGATFAVRAGRLVGLVGESGCGKSTTVRSITGLLRPPGRVVSGSVRFQGEELRGLRPQALRRLRGARIGFVPQNPFGALNPVLPIGQQMTNVLRAHREVSKADSHEVVRAALLDVGIAGPDRVMHGYAHELSGGMAQRVVIATSLLLDPSLLIADEPTNGLDVTVQRQILDLLAEKLRADAGRSALLVTHDLRIVAQYCQDVVIMYAGEVVETGPVASVFRSPAHPYTEALLEAAPRRGERLVVLEGGAPDLRSVPNGCSFAPRCRYRELVDDTVKPALRDFAPDRSLACHLPGGASGAG